MADFLGLMKQATQLQAKMQEMQAELDQITVEGTAGGGLVSVTMSAKGDLKGVRIDDSLVKPDEKEIIEDLIVAAHADARRKAEALMRRQDEEPDRRPAAAAGAEVVLAFFPSPREARSRVPSEARRVRGRLRKRKACPSPGSDFRSSPPSPRLTGRGKRKKTCPPLPDPRSNA